MRGLIDSPSNLQPYDTTIVHSRHILHPFPGSSHLSGQELFEHLTHIPKHSTMAIPTITPTPTTPSLHRRDEWVLPLTTIFTPPTKCLTDPFTLEPPPSGQQPSAWRDEAQTSASCYPSAFYTLQHSWNWYSPGVCPSGYGIAQSRIMSTPSAAPVTQAWCCQSDFAISGSSSAGKDYQYCTSTARDASAIEVVNGSRVLTSVTQFVAYQWPMSVQWASGDLEAFTPASAPLLSAAETTIYSLPSTAVIGTGSAEPVSSAASVSSTSSSSTSSPDDSGVSVAAKAGIGVGVAVGAVLVVLALAFWFLRRRKQQRSLETRPQLHSAADETSFGGKAELSGDAREASQLSPLELSAVSQTRQEMASDGDNKAAMQKTAMSPVEMEGGCCPQSNVE